MGAQGCTTAHRSGRDWAVSPSTTSRNASLQVVQTAAALCICSANGQVTCECYCMLLRQAVRTQGQEQNSSSKKGLLLWQHALTACAALSPARHSNTHSRQASGRPAQSTASPWFLPPRGPLLLLLLGAQGGQRARVLSSSPGIASVFRSTGLGSSSAFLAWPRVLTIAVPASNSHKLSRTDPLEPGGASHRMCGPSWA